MTKENLMQSAGAAALAFPSTPLPCSTVTPGFLLGMGQAGRVLVIYLPLGVLTSGFICLLIYLHLDLLI